LPLILKAVFLGQEGGTLHIYVVAADHGRENMSVSINPGDARKLIFKITRELFPNTGCHDASCVFGHAGGMATNGGCECIKGEKVELRRTLQKLSLVARELASRMLENRDI
jgi:hypothetical protein